LFEYRIKPRPIHSNQNPTTNKVIALARKNLQLREAKSKKMVSQSTRVGTHDVQANTWFVLVLFLGFSVKSFVNRCLLIN